MNVSFIPPGRCLLRQPPERGEAQRIPRYHPKVPWLAYHLFCPTCGHRVVVIRGITETNPHEVEEDVETSDGGTRHVKHLVPSLTVVEQRCDGERHGKTCGSRWGIANGAFVFANAG